MSIFTLRVQSFSPLLFIPHRQEVVRAIEPHFDPPHISNSNQKIEKQADKMIMKGSRYIYFLPLSLLISCLGDGPGSFSFHTLNEAQLSDMERKLYFPKKFQKKKKPIVFYADNSLWYSYQLNQPSYGANYTVAFSRKYNAWLELDIQNKKREGGGNTLTGKLGKLEEGHYLLQVFSSSGLLDQIKFDVFPSKEELVIDYDSLDIMEDEEAGDDI